jgi:hypothetical protein
MVTRTDIMNRRDEIIRIAEKHGAHDVRLFGSVARDAASTASDVDVLVRMDGDRSLLDRIALIQELEDLLRCKVDVVNDRAIDPLIQDNILAQALPL